MGNELPIRVHVDLDTDCSGDYDSRGYKGICKLNRDDDHKVIFPNSPPRFSAIPEQTRALYISLLTTALTIWQLCPDHLCAKQYSVDRGLVALAAAMSTNFIRSLCLAIILINSAVAGPITYALCQGVCGLAVAACFTAAGVSFGTVPATLIAATPALAACNGAYAACQAACAAMLIAPTL